MKKAGIALSVLLLALCFVLFLSFDKIGSIWSQNVKKQSSARAREAAKVAPAVPGFPSFYKGIYLTSNSGKDFKKLQKYVSMAQEGRLNTLVIDVQDSRIKESAIPKQNIDYCIEKGFHTVARVVVFPDGLKKYPVDPQYIANKLAVAENACKLGFREIQFDYIRFNDHGILKKIPLKEKYAFIENFLRKARAHLKPYNVRIAADVFGRIPLNKHDPIGQRMEGLDEVADVICPMAYPSHYTWSKKLMSDPYTTVFITSKKAKERVTRAHIVTYIQAFKMKVKRANMPYEKYIHEQIRAVHDAGASGFILWNASQDYSIPCRVSRNYYTKGSSEIVSNDGPVSVDEGASKTTL